MHFYTGVKGKACGSENIKKPIMVKMNYLRSIILFFDGEKWF